MMTARRTPGAVAEDIESQIRRLREASEAIVAMVEREEGANDERQAGPDGH
jgi:hypothetical protein